jgi:hypothetical protein
MIVIQLIKILRSLTTDIKTKQMIKFNQDFILKKMLDNDDLVKKKKSIYIYIFNIKIF